MIVKELIERVQSLYSHGAKSDDSRLSNRHIYSKLKSSASKLIRQDLDRKRAISDFSYTYIDCIKMICAEIHECPCLPPVGKKFWRSEYKLPEIINSKHGLGINFVSTISGEIQYSKTTFDQVKYISGNRYTSDSERYFIKNDYLYVLQKNDTEVLSISALFVDPQEVEEFKLKYCGADCDDCSSLNPLDLDFNIIDESRVDSLIQLTVEEVVRLFASIPQDIKNDDEDRID